MSKAEMMKCYIAQDATAGGQFTNTKILTIDGKYDGSKLEAGELYVGKTGKVKADIKADFIIVEGIVIGNIHSNNRIILMPTAKVIGNIKTNELIIQKGVVFEGNCIIVNNTDPHTAKENIVRLYDQEN
jgi:cytoskeletal protein CcmA (bactofilin family)